MPGKFLAVPTALACLVFLTAAPAKAASPEEMRAAEARFLSLREHPAKPASPVAELLTPPQERDVSTLPRNVRAEVEHADLSDPQQKALQDIAAQGAQTAQSGQNGQTGRDASPYPAALDAANTRAVFFNIKRNMSGGDVRPYVKGGLGLAYDQELDRDEAALASLRRDRHLHADGSPMDARPAWNAGVGVDVDAAENLRLDFGYRATGDFGGSGNTYGGAGFNPLLGEPPSGGATHLFSVGVHVSF